MTSSRHLPNWKAALELMGIDLRTVPRRAFEVLVILRRHYGQVVPFTTFEREYRIIEQNSFRKVVCELRQVLRGSALSIDTCRGGYRLVIGTGSARYVKRAA